MLHLLPGLYLAALALLLAGAVRRWLEPLPWRVPLALLALVVALFHPVLLAGEVLLPLDKLRGFPPYADLPAPAVHGNFLQQDLLTLVLPSLAPVRAAWAAGEWPLWNGRLGGGLPLLADPQSQALQPLALLVLPLPLLAGVGVLAALRVFVALLGTWLFLRRLGLGEGPALAGAFAWGLGGFTLLWLGWPLANAAALLPVAAWAAARCVGEGAGRRDAALVAVATAALLLAGQPEVVLYAGLLVAAVALGLAWRGGQPAPPVVTRLGRWLAASALGALLAAPALLPAAAAAAHSERAAMLRGRAGGAAPAPAAAPARWRDVARARWLPVVAPNAFGNDRFLHYWGAENVNEDAAGFAGSAAALLALLGLLARRRDRLPGERVLQAALAAALLLMALPPAWRPWLDALPPPLASPSWHHRLLLVVGFCLAALAACELDRFRRGVGRRWPVLPVAAALAGLVAWAYLAHPSPGDPETLAVLRFGWLRWHLRVLGATAVALLLLRGRRLVGPAVAALVAAELALAHLPANPPMPAALAFPPRPALERLRELAPPPSRVLVLDAALPPNVASLLGVAEARALNPMQAAGCAAVLAPLHPLGSEQLAATPALQELVATMGVAAALGTPATVAPPGWRVAVEGPGARVLVPPAVRPPVWVAGGASGEVGALRWRHLGTRVAVEWPPAAGAAPGTGVLATSLCDDGGWRGLAGGRPVATAGAGAPFVAVRVPPGTRRVELLQRPRGFVAGMALAALGLGAGLLWWLAPPPAPVAAPARRPRVRRAPAGQR